MIRVRHQINIIFLCVSCLFAWPGPSRVLFCKFDVIVARDDVLAALVEQGAATLALFGWARGIWNGAGQDEMRRAST